MSWTPTSSRYDTLQYRYCGKSGLRLPALSLGLWHRYQHFVLTINNPNKAFGSLICSQHSRCYR
ncbi:hypothetical protein LENIMA164B_14860 [Lelliottia nimipressuralis]